MHNFRMRSAFLAGLAASAVLAAALAQNGPETVVRGTKQFKRTVLITGLAGPWELTWGPDGMLWVTERTGKRISRIDPVSGKKTVAVTISDASAPGGQDGVLGMALHPELLQRTGHDFVYVSYTYIDKGLGPDPNVSDLKSPYRFLYSKVVRFRYDAAKQTLSSPITLLAGLPAGNDHNAGRVKFGPDGKLYVTVGDQGHDQLGNYCLPIEAQRLPTKSELDAKNYISYVGKSLRINLDGSIPADNPPLNGVVSHVYTYGHRNPQGLDFSPEGTLYSSEHGPKTDDEINVLVKGGNYGWPHVAGFRDNKAYEYARWAESTTPCAQLKFSDLAIPPSVPRTAESDFTEQIVEPLATMFTVPTGYNFQQPACAGVDFICWPTVGVSSVEYYASGGKGIPGWDHVLLATTLKRASLYVLPLTPDGEKAAGPFWRYFQSENRYRDTAVDPGGRTLYIATDPRGVAESSRGGVITKMTAPGAILAFTYTGEGAPAPASPEPAVTGAAPGDALPAPIVTGGISPQFTAAQAARGKTAYNSNCAVCHGSNMTNGTFGTPLAGAYFRNKWAGQSVQALYEKSQKTMPPAAPGSLAANAYADILAYLLETNEFQAGSKPLPPGGGATVKMVLRWK